MKVSFRLLAKATLLKAQKERLDASYQQGKHEAKRLYVNDLNKLREQYAPLYFSLQEDIDNFWREVESETGWRNTKNLSVLDSGELVHNSEVESLTGFCKEIFEDGGEGE